MPRPLSVVLTGVQRAALVGARDHHPKPYVRERAAAILRVADGWSARAVARSGCLKRRRVETVSRWVATFLAGGVAGLLVQPGRGRKPAFSPWGPGARAVPQRRGRPRRPG